jgi:hypothetical protein
MEVDLVEIDPLVYHAAVDYFNLTLPNTTTVNLVDGATYVHSLADLQRAGMYEGPKWSFVVQDCFSGGMVPSALFTREFWEDLIGLVEVDGIIAMVRAMCLGSASKHGNGADGCPQNFVGLRRSKASKAVLVTLLSVFTQCRAFGDVLETERGEGESVNMVHRVLADVRRVLTARQVVFCTVGRSRRLVPDDRWPSILS